MKRLTTLVCCMMLMWISNSIYAQERTISGKVTDLVSGGGIPGANILVKGTNVGTVTDIEGDYTINVPAERSILVFSSVGFISQEVPVDDRETINVALAADIESLEEVIVVGYGVQRKSEVTGSVGVVSGEDLQEYPSVNALQSLRGKVAGVRIATNSGSPTGQNRVIIRGVGTINASSNPLYVVDGLIMDDIATMNPNDIQSIEVLKDASATAIYGSRGANGVILITTKRGATVQGTVVEYNGDFGIGILARKMDAMNAAEFMQVQHIAYENAPLFDDYAPGQEPQINLSDRRIFNEEGDPLYDTDWQEEATRTAFSHNHQFSIRSRGGNSSFGAFMNYTNSEGILLNSWLKRASVKLVYDADLAKWLSIGANVTVNKTWQNNVTEGGASLAPRSMIEVPSIFPVKWPDGTWSNSTQIQGFTFEGQPNPVHRLLEEERLLNRTRLFGNAFLEASITPSLQFRTQFGFNNVLSEQRYYAPTNLIPVGFPDGNTSIDNGELTYWQNENYFTYIQEAGAHRVNAVVGASWQQNLSRGNFMRARGFTGDFFRYNNIGAASNHMPSTSYNNDWTINSYFTRATYTYDDRYTITFSGRVDGSSRFGKNNKFGVFPSGGISWLVSNEDFMKDLRSVSLFRLRASYGVTGNTEIGQYQSLATIGSGTTLIGGSLQSSSFVQRLPNPDLEWEKTSQFNVGMELELFNQGISFVVDYYDKFTDDLLLDRPVPTTTGFTSVTDNIGAVSNRGIDFMVTKRNTRSTNLLWTSTLNFNFNKNRIERLGRNNEDIFPGPSAFSGSQTILRVGQPIGSFWGYERLGTWSLEEAAEAAEEGKIPGMVKRSAEQKIIGSGFPDWTGSFINRFNFGNFDATIDLQFVYGVQIFQRFLATAEDRQALTNGIATQLYESWTPDNQSTMIPIIRHTQLSGQDLAYDSHYIADGSYLRGNLFSLGYSFDDNLIGKMGIQQLRVTLSLENAFVIHSDEFKGYDPEANTHPASPFGQNIIYYQYPKPRTLTLGLNARF